MLCGRVEVCSALKARNLLPPICVTSAVPLCSIQLALVPHRRSYAHFSTFRGFDPESNCLRSLCPNQLRPAHSSPNRPPQLDSRDRGRIRRRAERTQTLAFRSRPGRQEPRSLQRLLQILLQQVADFQSHPGRPGLLEHGQRPGNMERASPTRHAGSGQQE